MTVVVVQCRMSSSRLKEKALLPLDGKPLISWTLNAMKKVKADQYYVATDKASEAFLRPVVDGCGWKIYAGSLNNVLERFCDVIRLTDADILLRATGDNPFLFYEAAQESLDVFAQYKCDYFTFSGLPHGSGVEVYKADCLLEAEKNCTDVFEMEHVGPAIYNHKDKYKVVFEPAPERYNFPELRTTVDTRDDYLRVRRAFTFINNKYVGEYPPYPCKLIVEAFQSNAVSNPPVLIPSVKQGWGTGHFHRCMEISEKTGAVIYLPPEGVMDEIQKLIRQDTNAVYSLDEKIKYPFVITDKFMLTEEEAKQISEYNPCAFIDEGSDYTSYADFLLDIIPSYNLKRKANLVNPGFITLPEHRKESGNKNLRTAFVALGGEDPAKLSDSAKRALEKTGLKVTVLQNNIPDLKEELYKYDLIVTHYGLTAFEAVAAGCAVILLGTTELHYKLAKKYGFECLKKNQINEKEFSRIIKTSEKLYPDNEIFELMKNKKEALDVFVSTMVSGKRNNCPVCLREVHYDEEKPDRVIARTTTKTIRRCKKCGMLYISWSMQKEKKYEKDYFFSEYREQYGKTYLDDFSAIKVQGFRRLKNILKINSRIKTVLDIGCAYGPFLSAVKDSGYEPYGIDIAKDAVEYLNQTLHIASCVSPFPDFDSQTAFGISQFDCITMWYVIEHFRKLSDVLKVVSSLVKKGGVFAFSTPSASGISGLFSKDKFFEQSPSDHFTIWEPAKAEKILSQFGFKIIKIISTGHHPERYPNKKIPKGLISILSRIFKWGDTCEIYCKKL